DRASEVPGVALPVGDAARAVPFGVAVERVDVDPPGDVDVAVLAEQGLTRPETLLGDPDRTGRAPHEDVGPRLDHGVVPAEVLVLEGSTGPRERDAGR